MSSKPSSLKTLKPEGWKLFWERRSTWPRTRLGVQGYCGLMQKEGPGACGEVCCAFYCTDGSGQFMVWVLSVVHAF